VVLRRIRGKSEFDRERRFEESLLGVVANAAEQTTAAVTEGFRGRVMRFLLRVAFWLSVVVLLLPSAPSERGTPATQVGATDAMTAASAAVADMRQFCTRQPDACAVGAQALAQFGRKAETGAKMLYDFLNEHFGAERGVADRNAPAATGSVAGGPPDRPADANVVRGSQHTLTPTDLTPAWRGPPPRREIETKRPA
jgi:hypothetical protein